MQCPCRAILRPGRGPAAAGDAQERIASLQCEPVEGPEQHRLGANHSIPMRSCDIDCDQHVVCLNRLIHVEIDQTFVVIDTDSLSSSRQIHLSDPRFGRWV